MQRRDGVTLGITDDDLRRWTRAGHCTPVGGGAYVIMAALPDDPFAARTQAHLRRAEAVVAGLPGSYLVGPSAAIAHGLPVHTHPDVVTLSRDVRIRSDRSAIECRRPWSDAVVERHGMPCQSVADCIIDIAAHDGLAGGLVTADAALHRRITTRDELLDAVERHGARRGVRAARQVAVMADGRIESPGETLLRLITWQAGLTLVPQVTIRDEYGEWVAQVDFVIDGTNVVVEFDGLGKCRTSRDLPNEKVRQVALERLGYTVVRLLYRDLERPGAVLTLLRDAIARPSTAAA